MRTIFKSAALAAQLGLAVAGQTQTRAVAVPLPAISSQTIQHAAASLALVVAGQPPGRASVIVGAAVVLREDGVLLTAYHVVKNAAAVQVHLRNGDILNNVTLLGVDAQRDIAAIKVPVTGLQPLPIVAGQPKLGALVAVISHSGGASWSAAIGGVLGYRSADQIPGAGSGFDVVQFNPPIARGSSGGVLLDSQGRGVGFISGGLNPNLAVPFGSVSGLPDSAPSRNFASGAGLMLPGVTVATAQVVNQPQSVATPDAPEKSESLGASTDKDALLHSIKTMYVDARKAKYFGSDQMKAALGRNRGFKALNIRIVDDPKVADTVLTVGYTFAWDFPFELKHQNTSIVLLSGKGVGPFSGPLGAASVATEFVKAAKPYRVQPKAGAR